MAKILDYEAMIFYFYEKANTIYEHRGYAGKAERYYTLSQRLSCWKPKKQNAFAELEKLLLNG